MDFLRIENGMTRDVMILRYLKHKEAVNTGDLRTKNGDLTSQNWQRVCRKHGGHHRVEFPMPFDGYPFFLSVVGAYQLDLCRILDL